MNNLITSIKENKVPLTQEQVEQVKELQNRLATLPTPTTKTALAFFISDIESYEKKSKAILEFVELEVSKLDQQHKDAVSALKQLKEQVVLSSQRHRILPFANELLAQDPEFKIEGLRKRTTTKLSYDEEELLISLVKKPEYVSLIKLQTDAQIKKYLPTLEQFKATEILDQITVEETKEIK